MRNFPDTERALATAREEHVLLFVVVDHADALHELRLQLEHALAALFHVADA